MTEHELLTQIPPNADYQEQPTLHPQQEYSANFIKPEQATLSENDVHTTDYFNNVKQTALRDISVIESLAKAGILNPTQGQHLANYILNKAQQVLANQPKPDKVQPTSGLNDFVKEKPDFFNKNGRAKVLDYLKNSNSNFDKDGIAQISQLIEAIEQSAIEGYLQEQAHLKSLNDENEAAKLRLRANAQNQNPQENNSRIFTREQIGKMRGAEFAKNEKIDYAKERILRKANEEARDIIQQAKDYADESIRKYNKWIKDADMNKEMEKERAALRDKLGNTQDKLAVKPKKSGKKHKASDFKLGDSVRVLSMNLKGTVSTLPNAKGDLYVQMGILRSQVNISDLELIDEPVITGPNNIKKTGTGKIKMDKSANISTSINLIGKTVDEALFELDKYLDDAYLAHLPQVTVIHGRGTGALKNAVHTHLKKTKYVKSYRLGTFGEGDQGVTIVDFK